MSNEYKYFVLLNKDSKKLYFLKLHSKDYVFIVTKEYFDKHTLNDFNLMEKLFVLGKSLDANWAPLSSIMAFIIFCIYNAISPSDLKLEFPMDVNEPIIKLKIKDTYERID